MSPTVYFFFNYHSFLPSFLKNRNSVPECYPPNSKLIHIQPKNSWSGLLPQWSQFSVLKFVFVTFLVAMTNSCKISLREEKILLTHPCWVWCNMIEKSLFKKTERNHTHNQQENMSGYLCSVGYFKNILISTYCSTFIILIPRLEFEEQLETYP